MWTGKSLTLRHERAGEGRARPVDVEDGNVEARRPDGQRRRPAGDKLIAEQHFGALVPAHGDFEALAKILPEDV